jgi:MFS family permease
MAKVGFVSASKSRHDRDEGMAPIEDQRVLAPLLPIVAVAFVLFLVTGVALPALPLHVHRDLGLDTFAVGLVAGAQFAAALLSRFWAGRYADSQGAKRATVVGLLLATAAGLVYLLSLRFVASPVLSATILLAGRAVLGAAESCVVTGAMSWGLGLVPPRNAGQVMAWVGLAMYVALAVGAPAGTVLFGSFGFIAIAFATAFVPIAGLLLVGRARGVMPQSGSRPAVARVVNAVWLPGVGLALSSIGFGAITTFIVLLFARQGWGQAWLGLSAFFGAFVLGRLTFGHLPDRMGGARVALVSVLIEAAGLALIGLAPSSTVALVGAALTGFGYTLVYPGFGVEAVRRVPAQSRGLAMGAFTAFLDLALGLANPLLGLIASAARIQSVFLVSAIVVLCASIIAARLRQVSDVPRSTDAPCAFAIDLDASEGRT